jgi:tryptophan 2,3-dioxygenase
MTGWIAAGWVVTAGSIVVLSATIAWIWWQRRGEQAAGEFGESSGFSISRYQPMEHLLSEEDFAFLASQPGYEPEIGARWQRERRRIFRLYLDELKRDFRRLHAEARVMAANADAESAEMVGILMRQQVTFWRAMAGLELRLALRAAGIGKVDVRPLIELLEAMRVDLAHFSAPQAA